MLYPRLGEGGRRAATPPAKPCPRVERSSHRRLRGVRGRPGPRSLGRISEAGPSLFFVMVNIYLIYFHGKCGVYVASWLIRTWY